MSGIEVRVARGGELHALGDLSVEAYTALPGGRYSPAYLAELRDVEGRLALGGTVLVAVDDVGSLLGCVTYVDDPASPLAEFGGDGAAAGFRMLAVARTAQRRGAGAALVRACADRARAAGRARLVIHTTSWMTAAHRLYERLGFRRAPEHDWEPEPGVGLIGYSLSLGDGDGP